MRTLLPLLACTGCLARDITDHINQNGIIEEFGANPEDCDDANDSKVSAKDRMFRGRGRYVLVNGLVVADNWEALLAGELQTPINLTEISRVPAGLSAPCIVSSSEIMAN